MSSQGIIVSEAATPWERWADPVRGEVGFRTLVGDGTGTTDSLTAGVTEMEPGGWLGLHRHAPAEIYYVLEGHGAMRLGEAEHAVAAGSTVFIPGDVEHGIRNTGAAPLRFFYVFPVGAFTDIEYRFSPR